MIFKVLQDNRLTATKEEINMMMDIADKNKDGWKRGSYFNIIIIIINVTMDIADNNKDGL